MPPVVPSIAAAPVPLPSRSHARSVTDSPHARRPRVPLPSTLRACRGDPDRGHTKRRRQVARGGPRRAISGVAIVSLRRQGGHYLIVGGLQWLLDWGVMVLLSHLGLAVEPANVAGRISGALLGFWLNGRITFAGDGHRLGGTQLRRFLLMWLCTTALGTLAIGAIENGFGLHGAWRAKPAIDIALAAIGFVLSRHWVYKA
jgi:putative flippase GtrA